MSNTDNKAYTPMIQQYLTIKEDYADAIVFFRLGDFYEMFFDDAIIASRVLEITLTSKDAGAKIPMCGVPHHSVKPYIKKLIENGYKIAIAEQTSEPGKGLVTREVVRLITPGTVFEDDILESGSNNFIASLILQEEGYLLTYADISTGESFLLDSLNKNEVIDYIKSSLIKELIIPNESDTYLIEEMKKSNVYVTVYNEYNTHDNKWANLLLPSQKIGARHLSHYLSTTQKQPLNHLQTIKPEENNNYLKVDYRVLKQLEIVESNTNNPKTTVFYHLNNTKTAMGTRLLKHYLNHPLTDVNILQKRYDLIEAFDKIILRSDILDILDNIYDVNRIIGKLSFNSINARDLEQLKITLKHIPKLKEILKAFGNKELDILNDQILEHQELKDLLERSIIDNPPIQTKEGGMIKPNFNKDLDHLLNINEDSKEWLLNYENQEKERLGIKNLKVGYNRNFGYFIEISKMQALQVEDIHGYERRQTLTNSERYISKELKEQEDEILNAKERAIALEYEIFQSIKDEASKYIASLQELSSAIAKIDVFLSLKIASEKNNYVRPSINLTDRKTTIINGRHPVVEKFTDYIKNDIVIDESEIFLITGPNMSGKSTYMRMFALIIYLAQVGSFVPADSANIPIYDAIFTRIGSSDDLSGGKSTFMVEMVESNEALTFATKNSLILFDEIGRGTATYDGIALAQGMIEYIANEIKAQTLFSTHYHELTKLENLYSNITNLHVKAKEENGKMIFLHQVEKGASDRSYGIQVASLANLPKKLIKRSEEILNKLEGNKEEIEIDLFNYNIAEEEAIVNYTHEEVIKDINDLNIDKLTPIDAIVLLKNLQNKLKK